MCSVKPFRYNSLVTGQRAKCVITLCWVLSVGIGLTPMLGWNRGEGFILANIYPGLPKDVRKHECGTLLPCSQLSEERGCHLLFHACLMVSLKKIQNIWIWENPSPNKPCVTLHYRFFFFVKPTHPITAGVFKITV